MSTKPPVMSHGLWWELPPSNGHRMTARRSRCGLPISRPITVSSACGYAACPVPAMSSTLPPSSRTSKQWPCGSPGRHQKPNWRDTNVRPERKEAKKNKANEETKSLIQARLITSLGKTQPSSEFFNTIGQNPPSTPTSKRVRFTPDSSRGRPGRRLLHLM